MKHIYLLLSFFASLCLLVGCVDDPEMDTHLQNGIAPEVSETSRVDISASTMTLKASILKENGSQILECGVCWSDIFENSPKTNMYEGRYKKASKMENGEFEVTISDLHDKTNYYIYAYAINETDTAFSSSGTYTTEIGVGEVKTVAIDSVNVKATSVLVSGKIKSRGEGIENIGFYLSDKNNPPSKNDSVIAYTGDYMSTDSFSCSITNLKPSTLYYVRAFATNSFGEFSFNVDSFKTTDGKPKLGVLSLDSTSFTTADLSAQLIDEGDSSLTKFGFCWGAMEEPTIENADTILCSEIIEGKFSGRIHSLESNRKYYVRAYATNAFGTVYSTNIKDFFPKSQLPTVVSIPVAGETIVNGSAIVSGELQNEGMSAVTTIGLCWSITNKNPRISEKNCFYKEIPLEELDENNVFTYALTNLTGATTYYVNAYAANENGIQYGEVQSFTTPLILTPKSIYQGAKRSFSAAFAVDGQAFIVGGDLGNERTNESYNYNADMDEWSPSAPYSNAYSQMTACIKDGNAYIIGGTDNSIFATDVQIYMPSSNTWATMPSLPDGEGRYDAVSFVYRDSIYVLGGVNDNENSQELWKFTGDTWVMKTDQFPVSQQKGIALVANDKVYAGLGSSIGLKRGFWMASDSLTAWVNAPGSLPSNIGVVSSAVYYKNDQWDSFFMVDNNGKIWEYNLSGKWIEHPTTLQRMNNYHMFILNDKIYILGQDRFENNFFVMYDPVWDPGK